jgi:hypothetical protein
VILVCAAAVIATSATLAKETRPRTPAAVQLPVGHYVVSPDGHGNCVTTPCSTIDAAVARAKADHATGGVVQLRSGRYPAQAVNEATKGASTSNIVVEPVTGAEVTIAGLVLNASGITLRNLTFTDSVKLGTGARSSGVDRITTHNGGVHIGASHSFVTNSSIAPAVDSDGIQVKAYDGQNPDDIVIEHDVVGPTHRGARQSHVDCIQILGGSNIVIRYDRLFHCADQGIIVGSGASGTVSGTIDIERTEVQLCRQRTADCDGFDAINIRAPRVVFVHNTVIDGGVVFDVQNLTLAGSYLENLKTCTGTVIEANLIGATRCGQLPRSNRSGHLDFVDVAATPPNLTPRNPVVLPSSKAWVGGAFSDVDIDGHGADPNAATVGAVQAGAKP